MTATSKELDRTALDILGVGVFRWTPATDRLETDPGLQRLLGLEGRAPPRTMADLLAAVEPSDRYRLAGRLEACVGGHDVCEHVRIRRPEGAERWLEIHARSLAAGRSVRVAGACVDVTDRRERDGRTTDYLAFLSHEMRTPLNAIAGYAALMLEGVPASVTDRQADYLHRIEKSYGHMVHLIDAVLEHARVRSGKLETHLADVTVGAVLDHVDPLTAPQRQSKAIVYDCAACDRALALRADPDQAAQIMLNLVANAVKFTPPRGLIRVATDSAPGTGSISVRDNGVGMGPDQLRLLFEPYTRFDPTGPGHDHGTGLGLSISRALARGMNGEITVQSEPGRGSAFTLTLPLAARAAVA